jgi:hypothetical protein
MTNLLRIVHRIQVKTANNNQKRCLLLPVLFAWASMNSPRAEACHSGSSASWRKLQRKRAAGQENIMWVVVSGTAHNGYGTTTSPQIVSQLAGEESDNIVIIHWS